MGTSLRCTPPVVLHKSKSWCCWHPPFSSRASGKGALRPKPGSTKAAKPLFNLAAARTPGGRDPFIASGAQVPKPARNDVVGWRPAGGRDRPHLERILELVAKGAVRPPEVTRYKLSDAVAAHEVSQSRHFRGKLVFVVR